MMSKTIIKSHYTPSPTMSAAIGGGVQMERLAIGRWPTGFALFRAFFALLRGVGHEAGGRGAHRRRFFATTDFDNAGGGVV